MSARVRGFVRGHRLGLSVGTVLTGLALNVWVQDGTKAFLVVLLAVAGCALVIGAVGWLTGSQVVRHARREESAIQAAPRALEIEVRRAAAERAQLLKARIEARAR